MPRIALISDLHGNIVSLEAVLADAKKNGVDRIVCLGDVATLGPRPREVLARLQDLGCDCILGNHDEFMIDSELIDKYTEAPIVRDAVNWCRAQLSDTEIAFIGTFKDSLEVPLDNGTLFLFHGTPRSNMEDLLANTPPERVDEMLGGRRAVVMAGGHTHLQMVRQHKGILLVNPGSVGMPFLEYVNGEAPTLMVHAEYAIVDEGGVTLRRVAVDRDQLKATVRDSTMPLAPRLLTQYDN